MRLAMLALTAMVLSAAVQDVSKSGARKIEERFFAPCCWHESLAVHDSPIAKELRAEVELLISSGTTEAEIVDLFVARYGERILQEPRGPQATLLTALPWMALGLAVFGLALYLKRLTRASAEEPTPLLANGPPLDDHDWDW